jgi:hypothetical protein
MVREKTQHAEERKSGSRPGVKVRDGPPSEVCSVSTTRVNWRIDSAAGFGSARRWSWRQAELELRCAPSSNSRTPNCLSQSHSARRLQPLPCLSSLSRSSLAVSLASDDASHQPGNILAAGLNWPGFSKKEKENIRSRVKRMLCWLALLV